MQRFKNPFSRENQPAKQIKRNAFDLSHQNNLTMQMGVLYPCLCQEVIPGDTFKIDTAFGIRMLPLLFPIQTKIRVDLHYFYVRNRNLWDDWQNFITSSNSNYQFPTLSPRENTFTGTGSLYDYLGCPTRVFTPENSKKRIYSNVQSGENETVYLSHDGNSFSFGFISEDYSQKVVTGVDKGKAVAVLYLNDIQKDHGFNVDTFLSLNPDETLEISINGVPFSQQFTNKTLYASICDNHNNSISNITIFSQQITPTDRFWSGTLTFKNISNKVVKLDLLNQNTKLVLYVDSVPTNNGFDYNTPSRVESIFIQRAYKEGDYIWSNQTNLKLSALPFRAYESIYNSFYRDQRNNPFKINGVVTPNKYLPSTAGGYDSNIYQLRRRNWEQDAFTTCLPQPQQGPAPVIGMSATGMATMQDDDGKLYQVKLITDSSGDRIVNFETGADVPSNIKQSALNLVNNGFTINDFRNANSLQRWLECNYRNGLKYKDQIASHFGVDIQYATLDMPEFLGGVSQFINVDQINQMSETQDNPLGSYAGQGSCIGKQSHTINKYCDEHGFIIGIISINPVPVYSQNLPKHFLKTGQLDYYFPEFGHIGYQPITYNEVCPLQASLDSTGNQVLGYQRPWYEYLQSFDEIHGLFRTDFKDFVLQRQFKERPSLTPEFLTISESQLNDVFAVQSSENADRFLGQIHFNIIAKRPIPRYGIPKLE